MQKEEVVGIAVRLFAIFLFLYTLRYVSGLLPLAAAPPPNNVSLMFIFLLGLFPILAAVLLWFFPLTVAGRIIPNIKSKTSTSKLSAGEIEVVAFSVMGLWVLTFAIPDTFYWVTFVLLLKNVEVGNVHLTPDNIASIVTTIVELAIGFWLLFGSRGVFAIVRRFRQA